jgi:acyl-coenzyme A thioesterase PaaI-like protein
MPYVGLSTLFMVQQPVLEAREQNGRLEKVPDFSHFSEDMSTMNDHLDTLYASKGYVRADREVMASTSLPMIGNLIHDTLQGEGKIEDLRIYINKDTLEATSVFHLGSHVCGHPKTVHGGLTAALLDNSLGWMVIWLMRPFGISRIFTANLSIDYKARIPTDSTLFVETKIVGRERRKIFVEGTVKGFQAASSGSREGKEEEEEEEEVTYATCKGLFIIDRSQGDRLPPSALPEIKTSSTPSQPAS